MAVSKEELAQALKQLLTKLEESGLKLNISENKQEFLYRVSENILTYLPNLHRNQLDDPKFLKACTISLLSEALTRQKGLEFDYSQLFNENIVLEQKDEFKRLFSTLLKYSRPELSDKEASDMVDDLSDRLANDAQDNFANDISSVMMKDNDTIINIMSNLLTLSMVSLFGVDPDKGSGQQIQPVLGVQGNLSAIPIVSQGSPESISFMEKIKTENWLDNSLKGFGVYITPSPLSSIEPTPRET